MKKKIIKVETIILFLLFRRTATGNAGIITV